MDMFTDSCGKTRCKPTAAEIASSIRRAEERGWRIIPDAKGTYIACEPDYRRGGHVKKGHINRVPDAAFLVDFLSPALLRLVAGTHAKIDVVIETTDAHEKLESPLEAKDATEAPRPQRA